MYSIDESGKLAGLLESQDLGESDYTDTELSEFRSGDHTV